MTGWRSRRFAAAAAAVLIGCSSAQAQSASRVSFSRITTEPGLGRVDFVLAVADLNGDGRDDIVAGGREEFSSDGAREDRFEKTTLHVFVGEENGSLTPVPELVEGAIEARSAIVVAADFNGDTRADLAIFDEGVYVGEESNGYGNPPQLFLSSPDGRLRPSDALADAVGREHGLRPNPDYSGLGDLHLKSATAGDIDGDGDIDLWVDSIGGANVSSHFMVNNGVSMLSRARIEGRSRPPRGVNPYIRAPAPTCTYDGRTSRPIPTSPPVSVRTDRGTTVPARDSDGRARRTRRPANPCTCRARSMTLILCGGLRKSGQSSTSRS